MEAELARLRGKDSLAVHGSLLRRGTFGHCSCMQRHLCQQSTFALFSVMLAHPGLKLSACVYRMSSENEHGSPCGPEQQGISGGGGSRGLQNITNRLESGHVNATSSIERSTLTAASSADGSWLVGKRGFAVRSEASSVHKISSKEDTLGKYALAQPPSGTQLVAIQTHAQMRLIMSGRPSSMSRVCAAAGPRRASEGTGETRQRVIKLIKDETRNLLEMHVCFRLRRCVQQVFFAPECSSGAFAGLVQLSIRWRSGIQCCYCKALRICY